MTFMLYYTHYEQEKNMDPFFSIIIPVFNSENTIYETLESVFIQTYNNYEVIIINDCSTDGSLSEIDKIKDNFLNIKIIHNSENFGVAESRNIGIRNATSTYIAFLDADDVWMVDKLEKQKSVIERTDCDICCTSYDFIDENSQKIKNSYIIPEYIDYEILLKQNYIGCSTAVVKRELLLRTPMDKNYQHEDYALWLKLSRNGSKIIGIREPLIKYRILNNSRSYNKSKAAKGRISIYMNQEKLGLLRSLYYFIFYAFNGLKKKLL